MKRWLLVFCGVLQAASALAAPASFRLDPSKSIVTFHGASLVHPFSGTTKSLSGELRADPEKNELLSATDVICLVETLKTGHGARDRAVYHTLKSERWKEIRFSAASVTPEENGKYRIAGFLSIAGIAKKIEFDAESRVGSEELRVSGRLSVSMNDFHLKPPGLARILGLKDEVWVEFDSVWRICG